MSMTSDELARLDELQLAYEDTIARIKGIKPTPIDPSRPDCMVSICSQADVAAMDAFNSAIRSHARALIDAAKRVAELEKQADDMECAFTEQTTRWRIEKEAYYTVKAERDRLAEQVRILREALAALRGQVSYETNDDDELGQEWNAAILQADKTLAATAPQEAP